MYCPDKLKLNKFRSVALPTPRQLFARFGYMNSKRTYSDTDSSNLRKVDSLKNIDRLNSQKLYEESKPVETTEVVESSEEPS